jgi:hypothetical protein
MMKEEDELELIELRRKFESARQWRDKEKERMDAIVNPRQRRIQSVILDTLNQVLQDG